MSQTDYLVKVARFQEREAGQGRPVAVIVTSRIAVADRARAPEHTVAVRLEPFDESRMSTWLAVWNRVNAAHFAAQGVDPLPVAAVTAHRALAEQPLLLLMLALYDAGGNALQRGGTGLRAHELYEELLRSFAVREISKHQPGLSDTALATAVESELRRLSVVAFAMFNRAALWITESELERDLTALPFGGPPRRASATGLRTPLDSAELTLGRFFFIHQARASQDQTRLLTYEFLHATFAEYLVARLTSQVLHDVAARATAATMSFDSGGPVDDDLLRALLSFQPLSLRAPVVDFLNALVPDGGTEREVLLRLYRSVNHTPPSGRFAGYRPLSPSEPARYAAYAANLLLLILCTGPIHAGLLYPEPLDPIDSWHSQALLWRSQLSTDAWTSVAHTIAVNRVWREDSRDMILDLDASAEVPPVEPAWTFAIEPALRGLAFALPHLSLTALRRKAYFQCSVLDDMIHHALEPLTSASGITVNRFAAVDDTGPASAAHLAIRILIDPSEENIRAAERFAAQAFSPTESADHAEFIRITNRPLPD